MGVKAVNFAAPLKTRTSVVIVHAAVRGRARFKVGCLYHSPATKTLLEDNLPRVDGIIGVAANPLTGNILVTFDAGRSTDYVATSIARVLKASPRKSQNGRASAPGGLRGTAASAAPANLSAKTFRKQSIGGEEPAWHAMGAAAAIALVDSSLTAGLSELSARDRLRTYGRNLLPASVPRSRLAILLDQIRSTPILLLIAAAGTSVLTGGLVDAAVILGVVGVNTAIGYVTESQSERTISSLKNIVRSAAMVIRDGRPREIAADQVTVGDLLVLAPGSYVAADSRLVEVDRLSLDESALTGESVPVAKTVAAIAADVPLADRINMAYMGTLVTGGQGLAVVVATGRRTEVGRIQILTAQAEAPQTPMQRQLDRLGRQLVLLVGGICLAIFGIGLLRGFPLVSMLQTAIALAVAAVPEGLPTIATSILSLGIMRMRRLHVLVRRLDAVETLGSVQAVCLDKTGTLTLNRMTVVAAYADGRSFRISNGDFREDERGIDTAREPQLQRLLDACVLCSEAVIEKHDDAYALKGSPTENALIYAAIAARREVLDLRRGHPLLKVRLRADNRAFMSTVHSRTTANGASRFDTFVKGGPEQVLDMCDRLFKDGCVVPLTDKDRRAIETHNEAMAGEALRVLGCAWREDETEPANNGDCRSGFVWLGLVGLADPLRDGMREVIRGFHAAGIDTVMVTGDQSRTAFAIGSQLSLSRNGSLRIVDSTHLTNLDPEVLTGLGGKVQVFARVSPAHKLQIVRALQQAGKVVAMTGDGINDSPALKAADIGIAMGTGGTDVAREVADLVLEDDGLETMLVAVSQGRTIYTNIRKCVHFLLSTNFSEVIVMFLALAAGLGQPMSAMQLLWINLISETSLGLALALEPPEPGIMERPPRDPAEPIIRSRDLERIGFEALTLSAGALGAYVYGTARYGIGAQASTIAFTSLTSGQILHALSSRSERYAIFDRSPGLPNPALSFTVVGSLALQGSIFLLPWLKNLLGVTSIGLADALVAGTGAVLPLLVNESAKKVFFKPPRFNPVLHPCGLDE